MNIPLAKGDIVLSGKFKNKQNVVSSIEADEHGQPVIVTDKGKRIKLLAVRIKKLMKENKLLESSNEWENAPKFKQFLASLFIKKMSSKEFKISESGHFIDFYTLNSIDKGKKFVKYLTTYHLKSIKKFGYILSKTYWDSSYQVYAIRFEEIISQEKKIRNAYHITFDIFLPNIKSKGLVPQNAKKLGMNYPKRIYFLNNNLDWEILAEQLFFALPDSLRNKIKNAILLKVSIPKQKFYIDPHFMESGFYCYGTIKPELIKVYDKFDIRGFSEYE